MLERVKFSTSRLSSATSSPRFLRWSPVLLGILTTVFILLGATCFFLFESDPHEMTVRKWYMNLAVERFVSREKAVVMWPSALLFIQHVLIDDSLGEPAIQSDLLLHSKTLNSVHRVFRCLEDLFFGEEKDGESRSLRIRPKKNTFRFRRSFARHISSRIFNDTRNLLIIIDREQTDRVQVSISDCLLPTRSPEIVLYEASGFSEQKQTARFVSSSRKETWKHLPRRL